MIVESKLCGTARIWWTREQRHPYLAIYMWEDMERFMTRQFIPIDYRQGIQY